ncbi:MAG: S8 family serine peptidase [Clostridia bacterium]|nr:S8 family serine peptidase [Clostridia bacterium]
MHLGKESKEWAIQAIEMLYEREDVFYATVDAYNSFGIVPNDTEYSQGNQTEFLKISMPSAWDIQRYAANVTVGIIDSGIEMLPELDPNLNVSLSRSFDPNDNDPFSDTYGDGHGTKVASLIGAKSNNSTGMAGICWEVQMVSLKVGVQVDEITEAVKYAKENNIRVINCSMGRPNYLDENEKAAIESFPGLFICIAGNDGTDNDAVPYYPASYDLPNIIVVGASSTLKGKKWSHSNYGANTVDLFAPGQNIRVLTNAGSYENSSGTSFAAPIVTGVVALMIANNPGKSREWIKDKLFDSVDVDADAVFNFVGKCATGGHLNAYKALCPHDSPEDYEQATPTNHWITCECGYQGYMLHRYDTIGESVSSNEHYAYCVCGASTV